MRPRASGVSRAKYLRLLYCLVSGHGFTRAECLQPARCVILSEARFSAERRICGCILFRIRAQVYSFRRMQQGPSQVAEKRPRRGTKCQGTTSVVPQWNANRFGASAPEGVLHTVSRYAEPMARLIEELKKLPGVGTKERAALRLPYSALQRRRRRRSGRRGARAQGQPASLLHLQQRHRR